jgi:hypothetical protein
LQFKRVLKYYQFETQSVFGIRHTPPDVPKWLEVMDGENKDLAFIYTVDGLGPDLSEKEYHFFFACCDVT